MFRRTVMSASSRLKEIKVVLTDTVIASKNMIHGNTKAQIRALQSKSSPVYKTQSETSLVSGFRNLSIRDKPKQPTTTQPTRRGFCTGNSGRINIRSLQDLAKIFQDGQFQNVVVIAGAGISTPSGIPDFRTPGTGLYDNLQQYQIPYPEAIFDIDYFHRNPKPFFTLAKELFPSLGNYRPNYIHYFIRLLHEKGLLLRMYTQNIDGLERLAGIPPAKLVEAHGTFAMATCVLCGYKCDGEDIKDRIVEDKIPKCKKTSCPGMVKPDIVFFGEDLPRKFYYHFKDMLQADVIIVMGTSLEVQPFAGIIDSVKWNVPRILFNRDVVGPFRHHRRTKDVVAEGDILETMQKFVTMIGWRDEMKELITNSEGSFKIGMTTSIPVTVKNNVEEKKSETKTYIKDPFVNAIWRQNASFNLNDYCSSDTSSESESSSSSESESSEDNKTKPVRRFNNRHYSNSKNSATKLKLQKGQTQSYSTSANNVRRVKQTSRSILQSVKHKPPIHIPVIKTTPYGSSTANGNSISATNSKSHKIAPTNRNIQPSKETSVKPPLSNSSSIKAPLSNHRRLINNTSPGFNMAVKDRTANATKPGRTNVTSVQVYKALRQRSASADLPRLRLREKLSRNVVESSSSESVSGTSSGS